MGRCLTIFTLPVSIPDIHIYWMLFSVGDLNGSPTVEDIIKDFFMTCVTKNPLGQNKPQKKKKKTFPSSFVLSSLLPPATSSTHLHFIPPLSSFLFPSPPSPPPCSPSSSSDLTPPPPITPSSRNRRSQPCRNLKKFVVPSKSQIRRRNNGV